MVIGWMRGLIAFIMGNLHADFFRDRLIASAICLARSPKPLSAPVIVEALFKWFSSSRSAFHTFIRHIPCVLRRSRSVLYRLGKFAFPDRSRLASFGFGRDRPHRAVARFDMRACRHPGAVHLLLGAAGGHIYQMISAHNSRPAMPASFSGATSSCRSLALRCCGCSTGQRLKLALKSPSPRRRACWRRGNPYFPLPSRRGEDHRLSTPYLSARYRPGPCAAAKSKPARKVKWSIKNPNSAWLPCQCDGP